MLADVDMMFQFTHPGRGATREQATPGAGHPVSIHAPREGCDFDGVRTYEVYDVSIHAPWEGCDKSGILNVVASSKFQFTHPGKGATF